MTQERKSLRAPVSLAPRYRSPSSFEFVQGQCLDLSEGGMFIAADLPCDSGTLIKFECQAEGGALRGVGRVVWRRTNGDASRPSGMGVKFVKLEPGSPELIAKLVADAQASGLVAMPAQVRETDSYRPEQERKAQAQAEATQAPSTEGEPATATPSAAKASPGPESAASPASAVQGSEAAAIAQTPSRPSDRPPHGSAGLEREAAHAHEPAAEPPVSKASTSQAPAAADPHDTLVPSAEASGSNAAIWAALAVGAVLLLWLLLR